MKPTPSPRPGRVINGRLVVSTSKSTVVWEIPEAKTPELQGPFSCHRDLWDLLAAHRPVCLRTAAELAAAYEAAQNRPGSRLATVEG